ncbi:MAG: leucyl aminopeptidase [Sutterellaceae bacterium]|nr:leucyl aminopeptidase [Burkholderiaceae bacterium]MCX7901042.1 leucyl aminopeptidase [Burkholderiaceae bacterium]MDW8430559.1 leucyl aminopeptidase [Sutterellaceae bacterium]
MDFITKVGSADTCKADCVAVGVYADGELTPAAQRIDARSGGAVRAAIRSGDMTGKRGSVLLLRALPGVAAPRVLLVGLGKAAELHEKAYAEAVRAAVKGAGSGTRDLALAATDWAVRGRDTRWQAQLLALAAREVVYRFDELKSKRDSTDTFPTRILLPAPDAAAQRAAALGLSEGNAIANGVDLAKRLGNLPGNVCTPRYLGEQARVLARTFKLGVEVLDERQIEKLGMGSFLSVARGSEEPPRLIVLKYQGGGKSAAPYVLVGKGITFDSGGISIKPAANMDEMKFDMCGAAAVFGTLRALAELKAKINVVGIVPACENLPSGRANKPGDIVKSMSGQTIEILNTDAEGRLILCDALTYAQRFKPAAVIDIATLTGACVVALGNVNSGLFATDEKLAEDLLRCGRAMLDPAWRLPLDDDYQDDLKSNFADMANIGSPGNAGAVIAACFLARFTKAYPWAHLDIAGTAWRRGAAKGATGRPVPLLTQFLLERAASR